MLISEVARGAGIRPSAVRYYEQIGILPAPVRAGGQRRYDETASHRLAIVQRARALGFTLAEIKQLFSGFDRDTPASARWRRLTERKLVELDAMMGRVRSMQQLLRKMQGCQCATLEQCGKAMYRKQCESRSPSPRR
ncbi:MAG TPA: MerR family transcriptional regulator [Vicinamibacterales bacterium]|nr:MerR family transcriptional regulator [Vicinamibacterales bacterium]